MIKIIIYLCQKIITTYRIRHLKVNETGVDNDGHAYIKLENGMTFFGPQPPRKEKKFYSLLPSGIKARLPFQCFQVAADIVIRYEEGNLKWGGPAKETFYKVKEGDVIAEMGAFRGYYTLYLAEKAGNSGKVIAIEPIPSNLVFLKKNVEANKLNQVTIVPKGVWNENDMKAFQRRPTDYQSGSIDISYNESENEMIEVNTLDKILSDSKTSDVDFMLIQLNGAEYEALEGLKEINPKHLAIAARYDKDGRKIAREIEDFLKQKEYSTKTLQKKFVYAHLN